MDFFEFKNFDYSGWSRPEHTITKDDSVKSNLYEKGYSVLPNFLNTEEIEELVKYYYQNHSIQAPNGGFFVSIYSKDISYRKKIHSKLHQVIDPKFAELFTDYKYTCFNYAAKYKGQSGELFIHQDMAQVNEMNYSQVGVWIPLVDVDVDNGTLGILPHTHFTIPPHRSLYHKLPFSPLYNDLQRYMQPVKLNAGDLFLFDIRLLHKSFVNKTDHPRISIAASLVPDDASFCMTYKDSESDSNMFEMLDIDDNFYLEFADFKSEKVDKPGKSSGTFVEIKEQVVTKEELVEFCEYYQLKPNGLENNESHSPIISIQEPNEKLSPSSSTPNKENKVSKWNRIMRFLKAN